MFTTASGFLSNNGAQGDEIPHRDTLTACDIWLQHKMPYCQDGSSWINLNLRSLFYESKKKKKHYKNSFALKNVHIKTQDFIWQVLCEYWEMVQCGPLVCVIKYEKYECETRGAVSLQFRSHIIFLHTQSLSFLTVHPLSSLSTSLPLAGPTGFLFQLCATSLLVCRSASSSSAFLLPFPLPLAGCSGERRHQGADPAAAWGREETERSWGEARWKTTWRHIEHVAPFLLSDTSLYLVKLLIQCLRL